MTSASGSRDAWPLPPYRRCSSRHPFLRRRPADGAWPRRPRPFVEWWYPWWDTLGAGEGLLGLPRGRRGYVKGAVVVQICETLFYIVQDAICGVRPQSKGKPGSVRRVGSVRALSSSGGCAHRPDHQPQMIEHRRGDAVDAEAPVKDQSACGFPYVFVSAETESTGPIDQIDLDVNHGPRRTLSHVGQGTIRVPTRAFRVAPARRQRHRVPSRCRHPPGLPPCPETRVASRRCL